MIHHKRHKKFKKLKEAQAETDKSEAVSNEESKAVALKVSKEESQAERLANAAKQKQAKLTPGSKRVN